MLHIFCLTELLLNRDVTAFSFQCFQPCGWALSQAFKFPSMAWVGWLNAESPPDTANTLTHNTTRQQQQQQHKKHAGFTWYGVIWIPKYELSSFPSLLHCFAQEDLHTDLDVLAGLDQLPHERLQLVVPLDQIAEVGVQGLLWSNTHGDENMTNGKRLRNEVAKKN